MSSQSERLQQRMRDLSRRFANELPSRLERLERALRNYESDQTTNSRFEAKMEAHKIAGAAGSFGYDSLSSSARELELYLVALGEEDYTVADSDPALASTHLHGLLERVFHQAPNEGEIQDAEELASESHSEETSGDGASPSDSRETSAVSMSESQSSDEYSYTGNASQSRTIVSSDHNGEAILEVVLLLGSTESLDQWNDLQNQLGYFGFPLDAIRTVEELEEVLERCDIVVVLAGVRTMSGFYENGTDLSRLGETHGTYLSLIAVSNEDSFHTRLEAVRSGAQAFFDHPIDMPRLIDRIEEIQKQAIPPPLHVLIVDDDAEQVSQIAYILQQEGMVTSVASDPSQIFSLMVESKPDLVITDMYMPGCTGVELAQLIRQQEAFVGIPIIFLSVEDNVRKHMDAMSHGGDDFIVKPVNPELLIAAVHIRAQRTREMRFFMERDSLTGLLNHSHLKQQLDREVQRAERIGRPVSFAMIDIDHFKAVNDRYGHLTGDRVLKSLSRLLHERLRKTDTIGRHGGEEFGVILFNTDGARAAEIMDNLRDSFGQLAQHARDEEFQVTFSCGIATYPEVSDASLLAEIADRSLYQAKQTGRNRVVSA